MNLIYLLLLRWWVQSLLLSLHCHLLVLLLLHHLLLLELLLSLLHLCHLSWVKSLLIDSARQMMGAEKNVNIVSVKDSGKLLVHLIDIHLWWKRQCLDKEHAVLKSCNIWSILGFPENLDWLGECSWDKSTVWFDQNWNWCRCINKECNWASLTWIRNVELCH